jgi:hypothetical protein
VEVGEREASKLSARIMECHIFSSYFSGEGGYFKLLLASGLYSVEMLNCIRSEKIWKESIVAQLRYKFGICQKRLSKTGNILNQDIWGPNRDLDQASKYKYRNLLPRQTCY